MATSESVCGIVTGLRTSRSYIEKSAELAFQEN